jgi:mannopine transport system substrate-binding protein
MLIGRRSALAGSAALGAATVARRASGQSAPTGGLESTLVVRTTGGAFEQALKRDFFDPFTKATGVRVVPFVASYGDMMAKAAAMEAANRVEWDLISPQYYELSKLSNMLTDLGDCSAMPNIAKEGVANACGRYGLLYVVGGQFLAYNPDVFKAEKPASWADFWNVERFPGPRALPNTGSPWATLIASLVADGVEPRKLFPLDLDRAFAKLDKIKPHVAVWWRTGSQSQQVMRSGNAVMSLMWSGTAYEGKHQGIPLDWTWKDAIADFGAWAMLKNAPHPNAARAFLDFYVTNPEAHAAFAREMGYSTSSRQGQALLPPELKQELGADPATFNQIIVPDADWLEQHRASTLDRWNQWISA